MLPALLWSVARIAVAVYVGLCLVVWFRQAGYVYYPSRTVTGSPADLKLPFRDLYLSTTDGARIHAWHVPAPTREGLTVLFCHGNAGNIGDWVWAARACRDMGFGFLVFDYRGYGRSTGRPTEEGTYRDARAAWAYLTGEAGLRPAQIVVHGWSLGGAVAAWLAARETPAALVLESPFSSARDMAGRVFPLLPARLLCRFRYDTVASVRQVRCPVLVAHSPHDETIPYAQGLRVFEAAPEPKRFVELGGAHNGSGFDADPAFRAALLEFLRAPGPLGGK